MWWSLGSCQCATTTAVQSDPYSGGVHNSLRIYFRVVAVTGHCCLFKMLMNSLMCENGQICTVLTAGSFLSASQTG